MVDRQVQHAGAAGAAAGQRAVWALGDYHRVAELLAGFGTELVRACAVAAGQRVLDVAAGTGNVAIRAAATGAQVVACDPTPELLDDGRRAAAARGVHLDWVEAAAEALPFADDEFDVVTSAIGVIFAPDHQRAADELLRVCRPGGLIGMINWPVQGFAAEFFAVFAAYATPPPGALSPLLWGTGQHLRDLFGDRVETLEVTEHVLVVDHFTDPAHLCEFYKRTFGPTIATYAAIAADPSRIAALDREFAAFAARANRGRPGGPARYEYPYVRVVARVRTEPVGRDARAEVRAGGAGPARSRPAAGQQDDFPTFPPVRAVTPTGRPGRNP